MGDGDNALSVFILFFFFFFFCGYCFYHCNEYAENGKIIKILSSHNVGKAETLQNQEPLEQYCFSANRCSDLVIVGT